MSYTITVPEDWLIIGATVYIAEYGKIEERRFTAFPNRVLSFGEAGFFYRYDGSTPVYYKSFLNIGKTVFETESEANEAARELNRNLENRGF